MNQLIIVSALALAAIFGFALIVGASTPANTISPSPGTISLPPIVDGKQDLFLKATDKGIYSPSYLKVKKGIPVRIHYSADAYAGCGREVIFPEFKIRKLAPSNGEALIEFTPTKKGKFPFHCSMQMFRGTIEVVE